VLLQNQQAPLHTRDHPPKKNPKIIIFEKGDHKNADAEFLAGPDWLCLKK
jgi:hypothetical protein